MLTMAINDNGAYAGILMKDGTEISHYGVKGMKWGKKFFGKVKGAFGKPNPIKIQMQNALNPKEEPSGPVNKKRGGANANNGNKSNGPNLITRAQANASQAVKQADASTRQSERSAALRKSSTINKEKEKKKKQSYVANYNWHHN